MEWKLIPSQNDDERCKILPEATGVQDVTQRAVSSSSRV